MYAVSVTADSTTVWLAGMFDSEQEALDWMDRNDSAMSDLVVDLSEEYRGSTGVPVLDTPEIDVRVVWINDRNSGALLGWNK